MKLTVYALIILVSLFAIGGTFQLVKNELENGNICPVVLGISASYIVLVCFTIVLISHVINFDYANWIYFIFIGLVTAIAITGTMENFLALQSVQGPVQTSRCVTSL